MQSNEQTTSKEDQPQRRRINLELFYYEQVGSRYYLRFTRFTLILVVGLTVVSIVALLAIFSLSDRRDALKEINVNINIPKPAPNSPPQTIIQPTPVRQPKPIKQPIINIPVPSPPSQPKVNEIINNAPANTQGQTKPNSTINEP